MALAQFQFWVVGLSLVALVGCFLGPGLWWACRQLRRQGVLFLLIGAGFLSAMATKPSPTPITDEKVAFEDIPPQVYTGGEIKPPVTMTFAGDVCTLGKDYTVAYSDNVEVGTGKATVTGIGNFTGTKVLAFDIVAPAPVPTVIRVVRPSAIVGLVYTAASQCGFSVVDPKLTVVDGTAYATAADDYSATFRLPPDTAEYDYRWADDDSKADFAAPWSIAKRGITDPSVTFAAIPDQTKTGSEIRPPVTMTFAGDVRTQGTDYTVAYSDNVEVGTGKATVTGIGNFKGTKVLAFNIVEPAPEPTVVSIAKPAAIADLVYTATEQTGVAYDERLEIQGGIDYVKGVDAGDYATAFRLPADTSSTRYQWADGSAGAKTVNWSIAPRPVDDEGVVITEIEDQFYTGAAIEPAVAMSYGGQVCVPGDDYTVVYADNVNVGTARAIVSGHGNFSGAKTITFAIKEAPAGSSVVKFDKTEGIFVTEETRSVENGTAVGALPVTYSMTREFVGWFTAAEGGEAVTAETVVTGDITFYAQWTPMTPTVIDVTDSRVTFGALADEEFVCGGYEPAVEMFFNGTACEKGVDYEVVYSNNLKVGTGYAIVTGIGNFGGEKTLSFRILPIRQETGGYFECDLEDDLGVVLDEIDGVVTDYRAGDKVTVKIEGLAKGLKLVQDKTSSAWILSGVPTETALFATQPMFARVTVTYKDKTKGTNGKSETLQLLPLDIVAAETRTLAPAGILDNVYEPIDIGDLWPEAADAAVHPKDWTIKGWPAGILYNNTDKPKAWKGKVGGMSVEKTVDPYEVYGVPTKAGTFALTATYKYKPEGSTAAVSETLSATMTVWADEEEKSYRYIDQVGVATTNVTLGADVKSVAGLPTGLKFTKGVVSGTPTKAGVFSVTITPETKGAAKETFLWLVEKGVNDGVLAKIGWEASESTVTVMQGVIQNWSVDVPAGAKVTVTGLPTGLAFKQDSKTKLWTFGGTPTKEGNYVVIFKTVLNGETVTERIAIVVGPNEWTGAWYGVQKDSYTESSLNVLVNVAANGTVKLTLAEGIEKTAAKTSVTAKNLNNDGHSATLNVMKGKDILRTFTVDFEAGTFAIGETVVADLCETAVSLAADKSVSTFVLEEVADGETNAYAYVTATYDAKKNAFTLAGKLWDGTAVKGASYPLTKETADGGHLLSPVLLTDKAKNAVYLELSDDGSYARVLENGEKIAIGKGGTTPWTHDYLASELKNKTFAGLVPEATACVVLVDAESSPRQDEVSIDLTTKELGTKLAANGLVKLTLTDKFGWKWVCEMLPVDNGGTQFRGIATGTKRGETTQVAPVWSR